MVRNAGKFGKPKRGGKKQFTQNLAESDRAGMWDGEAQESDSEGSSDESSSDSEGSSSGEEGSTSGLATTLAASTLDAPSSSRPDTQPPGETRADRKAAKKIAAGKAPKPADNPSDDEDDDAPGLGAGNSNRAAKKSVKINEISLDTGPLNRKEREAAEKKAAQERYWKLHQAGKTDEAKVDLARLAKIRQEREQAAAFRKAETEAKAKEAADKAALSGRRKK